MFVGPGDPEQEVRGRHPRLPRLPHAAQPALAAAARRARTAASRSTSRCCSARRAARHARRALPRARVERGADGALRRRRSVPVRQRARGLLRAAHRGVLQARPGARLRGDGRARRRWTAAACCTTRRIRSRSPRSMDAVLDDADLEDAMLATQDAALDAAAARRTSAARCCASSTRCCAPRRRAGAGGRLGLLGAVRARPSGSRSCAQFRPAALSRRCPTAPGRRSPIAEPTRR